jgi:methionine sulfoxide reductase heme-binding subunit
VTVLAAGSPRVLWYLTRGTGVVALLLLTAVVLLGVLGAARWRSGGMPRFLVQGLHRNLTLLSIAFVAAHVVTTVADGFAPISLKDAIIPFASAYRPVWLGLGAVAFDLLLALTVTSLLRARIGVRAWRSLHWLAYASWPVALAHSLGTGSDARVGWLELLAFCCTVAVALASLLRALPSDGEWTSLRGGAAAAAVLVPLGLVGWYRTGPGAPGWAARAGTPSPLLAAASVAATASLPATPFSRPVHGTIVRSRPGPAGLVTIQVRAVSNAGRVGVWLRGDALPGGGVRVRESRMWFGTKAMPNLYVGPLAMLRGASMSAVLRDARGSSLDVSLRLRIDRAHGTVTGTLSAGGRA